MTSILYVFSDQPCKVRALSFSCKKKKNKNHCVGTVLITITALFFFLGITIFFFKFTSDFILIELSIACM